MVLLQLFLAFTRTGRAMQAAAQSPETAQLMGINLTRITAYTYGIGGLVPITRLRGAPRRSMFRITRKGD
jgi:branched-subunit amino acid ABC-type transport system permease component